MTDGKTNSSRIVRSHATKLALFAVAIVGCGGGGFSDVRATARTTQCERNLRMVHDALLKYVSLRGDMPRDSDGTVSIRPLENPQMQRQLGIDSPILRCPADTTQVGSSYLLNPHMSVDDLGPNSTTIVACDNLPNHPRPFPGDNARTVLIGDGAVVLMDLPKEAQEDWLALFLSGDKRASHVSMEDGSHRWTQVGIKWYTGARTTEHSAKAMPRTGKE